MAAFSYGGNMDFGALVTNIGSLAGALGIVELIKFFVGRKDKKQERKEDRENDVDSLRKELKQHLIDVNAGWKETYCDKNSKAVAELSEVTVQLKDNILLLTENISQMQEYNTNVGDAVKGIIHDRLLHNVDCYIERGGITHEELATLKSMYDPYKSLGGNGDIETAYNIALKLPVITKNDALERDNRLKKAANA